MQEKSREISIIKERILKYLDFKGISKYECYQKTGNTNGILSQPNGISEDNLLKFLSHYKDINQEWLLFGNGQVLKSNGQNLFTPSSDSSNNENNSHNNDNENSHSIKINNPDLNTTGLVKTVENLTEIMKTNAEIEKIKAESNAESIRLNAENEKLKLENERLNAMANDRNSKSMELIISSILASGETPHEKKRTTSEKSP